MTKRLRARGLSIVGEGSIYPLLGRLERDGLVETRRAASNGGPPRKYYSLSPEGERVLEAGIREWQMARDAVDGALGLVKVEVGP
jgi:PadR family transcriptional regulator PadR